MKKKIVTTVTAMAMTVAMATGAFATPIQRGSGDADANSVVNSNDASKIVVDAVAGKEYEAGNFDGDWRTRDTHMDPADANTVLGYVLQPENYEEKVGLRFYSTSSTAIGGGAFQFFTDSELASDKSNYQGVYADKNALFTDASNLTIDDAVTAIASNDGQGWTEEAISAYAQYLGGIYFIGDHGTAGQRVCLTTEEGWTIFNWAMRAIVPVSEADIRTNCPTRLDPSDPTIYTDINALDAATQARIAAFNELKAYIVSGVDYQTNIDTKDPMVLADMWNKFKEAFPAEDLNDDNVAITASRFADIYCRRYNIDTNTQNGAGNDHIAGNDPTDYTKNGPFMTAIKDNDLYKYTTATFDDLRSAFGDQITISTTKRADEEEGDQEWSFTIEFYNRYEAK